MNDLPEPPFLPTERHGCVTAWLILMIVANAATAVVTPLSTSVMRQAGLQPSPVGIAIIVLCCVANILFAVALFRWQRWGFYGFIATSVVALATNLSLGLSLGQSVLGLIGIAILYGVLNVGGDRKAWPRLR